MLKKIVFQSVFLFLFFSTSASSQSHEWEQFYELKSTKEKPFGVKYSYDKASIKKNLSMEDINVAMLGFLGVGTQKDPKERESYAEKKYIQVYVLKEYEDPLDVKDNFFATAAIERIYLDCKLRGNWKRHTIYFRGGDYKDGGWLSSSLQSIESLGKDTDVYDYIKILHTRFIKYCS
jgi:hypothetical protein